MLGDRELCGDSFPESQVFPAGRELLSSIPYFGDITKWSAQGKGVLKVRENCPFLHGKERDMAAQGYLHKCGTDRGMDLEETGTG